MRYAVPAKNKESSISSLDCHRIQVYFGRMFRLFRICAKITALCSILSGSPEQVAVLYNSNEGESARLARYYADQREIPDRNVIGLPLSSALNISREEFIKTMYNPLLRALANTGLARIEAMEEPQDILGRDRYELKSLDIRYLVTVWGVPVHIDEVEDINDLPLREALFANHPLAPQFVEGPLARNEASVDAELALLFQTDAPVQGFIPNPLFRQSDLSQDSHILRVARLDGPSTRAVRRMIDYTLQAESQGLKGAAYVDLDTRDGGYAQGNEWLSNCARLFQQLGFETFVDERSSVFPITHRMDAPALYAGWYAHNLTGPFRLPGFQFPPGAIAVHIHSFSAQNLRQAQRNWCGPMIDRGVTATVGNTAEPYLQFSHNVDAFFLGLANGWNLADAAYFALPVLSWQAVVLGDPLYRPFKVDLSTQKESIGGANTTVFDSYVIMRAMNLALADGERGVALRTGRRGLFRAPGIALGLKVAKILKEMDEHEAASRSLGFARMLPNFSSQDWIPMAEIAEVLVDLGNPSAAHQIMEKILSANNLPNSLEIHLLRRAIPIAERSASEATALDWRIRLKELTAPPAEE